MSKKKNGEIKSKKIGTRKSMSVSVNDINNRKSSSYENKILSKSINSDRSKNMKQIHKKINANSQEQIHKRKNKKNGIIKGPWSVQEDKLLNDWVTNNGPKNWTKCCESIQGRTGKQCREHWNNCLNPILKKGEWTCEEDFLIMNYYEKYNGSWKKIINLFNGRTENSIKNRFFSQLRKIATSNLNPAEKRFSSKIKLEELLQYLNVALSNAKKNFLAKNNYTEEELKDYLNIIEQKIKNKKTKDVQKEENEINETILSTNLSNLENSQNLLNKESKENKENNNKKCSLFNKKRKRNNNEEITNNLNIIEKEVQNDNNIINNNNQSILENNNNNNKESNQEINEQKHETKIDTENIQQQQPDINQIKEYNNVIDNTNNIFNNNNNYNFLNNPINMNNQPPIKKNDPINFIQNNNYYINNIFLDPFSQNFSLFDNYKYGNSLPYPPLDNAPIRHVDSLTDFQSYFTSNPITYNFVSKPSNTSIISANGNKIDNDIENPFMLNGQNTLNQNLFYK